MTVYVRPNLTTEQRDALVTLLGERLQGMGFDDTDFEPTFKLRLKLKDAKTIGT